MKIDRLIRDQQVIIDILEIRVKNTKMSKENREGILRIISDLKAKNEELFESTHPSPIL